MQTVADHSRNTAKYASEALKSVHLDHAGYLAGLLHDVGKCQHEFQSYLCEGNQERGSVIHTFQGCRMMLEYFHQDGAERYEDITSELIAYAIGAHHGQFDVVDEKQKSGFKHRMISERAVYQEAVHRFLTECADIKEIKTIFKAANDDLLPIYETLNQLAENSGPYEDLYFYIGLLARLLLSAVIEGDRRDTAEFMESMDRPDFDTDSDGFWTPYLMHMEEKLALFPHETEIQKARQEISDQCRAFAEKPSGVYRLSVPTGSGKTLSSLRFALAHAAKWKKSRIILTAPLLTILDQNAAIIREYIGDDHIILEHHSNIIHSEGEDGELDEKEFLEENWNAPVIITSMVQLLQTFFLGKTSSVRRFQALCNSIIIMDEVQTVPSHMLSLFNLTVNFLSKILNVTFVLCSATQPEFGLADHPLQDAGEEMVPYQPEIWKQFQRTDMIDAGSFRTEDVHSFIEEQLAQVNNLLVICNTKKEAEDIFRYFQETETACLHLSASMCMEHRRKVLTEAMRFIEESRKSSRKFLLVSTQVIEAGVDISFDCVIRLLAGMDSMVQAAGRCNRNAECTGRAPVYLVQCTDEKLSYLREIQEGKTASIAVLASYRNHPQRFECDLASKTAIQCYYKNLYHNMPQGYQDFTTRDGSDTLLSMLSCNFKSADGRQEAAGQYLMCQAFRTAGSHFLVYDDDTDEVVVPYGEGRDLISMLLSMDDDVPISVMNDWIKRAKPFTISLRQYQKDALGTGSLIEKHGVFVLSDGWYDEDIGFTMQKGITGYMEV